MKRVRIEGGARKRLFYAVAYLTYLAAVSVYYWKFFESFHDPITAAVLGILLLLIVIIIAAVRYSQNRESKRSLATVIAEAPSTLVNRLHRLTWGLAASIERALGEAWLSENEVPEGHEVIVRQVSLEALRKAGAWEVLPLDARDWLASPDASWPEELRGGVLRLGEAVHVLLWSLALTPQLRTLDRLTERLNFAKLRKALERPPCGMQPTWELLYEKDRAATYFFRTQAEAIYRGQVPAKSDEQRDAIHEAVEELHAVDSGDLFAGDETVGELRGEVLAHVHLSAAYRLQILMHLIELAGGKDDWAALERTLFGPFVAASAPASTREG